MDNGWVVWSVRSKQVDDYIVFSIATPKRTGQKRYVGVLGSWIPYYDKDDLIILSFMMLITYGGSFYFPGLVYRLCAPKPQRPWSFIFTSICCNSVFSLVANVGAITNSGEMLQQAIGRFGFLGLFFGTGIVVAINQICFSQYATPVGATSAVFAAMTHTGLLYPGMRYSLFGQEMNGIAFIIVQTLILIIPAGYRAFEIIPSYMSGVVCGLVSYLYFNELDAELRLNAYGIPVGAEKGPRSLIVPLLGLNMLFARICSRY
eukprot:CAMPEP_0203746024 /NCGR_PEP_ID=MMETSP0098-20131031/1587_1 /ASSEMBLY_ACC=CAM_ASM_000208 /TAXON_ID=96639 /ORGANISM=" , Strain NY0313808BC1" /LENGTH=260 /DNA_ID=CAMNT_0050633979 /DNA_START=207 /DNA_END=989 /DNA_ORIENTATION=-